MNIKTGAIECKYETIISTENAFKTRDIVYVILNNLKKDEKGYEGAGLQFVNKFLNTAYVSFRKRIVLTPEILFDLKNPKVLFARSTELPLHMKFNLSNESENVDVEGFIKNLHHEDLAKRIEVISFTDITLKTGPYVQNLLDSMKENCSALVSLSFGDINFPLTLNSGFENLRTFTCGCVYDCEIVFSKKPKLKEFYLKEINKSIVTLSENFALNKITVGTIEESRVTISKNPKLCEVVFETSFSSYEAEGSKEIETGEVDHYITRSEVTFSENSSIKSIDFQSITEKSTITLSKNSDLNKVSALEILHSTFTISGAPNNAHVFLWAYYGSDINLNPDTPNAIKYGRDEQCF